MSVAPPPPPDPKPLLTADAEINVSLTKDAVLANEDDIEEVINPKSSI